MSAPGRAARLWRAVAGATWWLVRVGGAAEDEGPARTVLEVTALCPPRPRSRRATWLRVVRVFRRGWITLLVALIRHEPLPRGRVVPEPGPRAPETEETEAMQAAEALPTAA